MTAPLFDASERSCHRIQPGIVDAAAEAKKVTFNRIGDGESVLPISGFAETRRSWNRCFRCCLRKFQAIPGAWCRIHRGLPLVACVLDTLFLCPIFAPAILVLGRHTWP